MVRPLGPGRKSIGLSKKPSEALHPTEEPWCHRGPEQNPPKRCSRFMRHALKPRWLRFRPPRKRTACCRLALRRAGTTPGAAELKIAFCELGRQVQDTVKRGQGSTSMARKTKKWRLFSRRSIGPSFSPSHSLRMGRALRPQGWLTGVEPATAGSTVQCSAN